MKFPMNYHEMSIKFLTAAVLFAGVLQFGEDKLHNLKPEHPSPAAAFQTTFTPR